MPQGRFEGAIDAFLEEPDEKHTLEFCEGLMEELFHEQGELGLAACDYFARTVIARSSIADQVNLVYGYVTVLADRCLIQQAYDWADELISARYTTHWVGANEAFEALILCATHCRDYDLTIDCLKRARDAAWMIQSDVKRMHAFLRLFDMTGKCGIPLNNEDLSVAQEIVLRAVKRDNWVIIAHYSLAMGAQQRSRQEFEQALAATLKVTNRLARAEIEQYIERLVNDGHQELLQALIRDRTRAKREDTSSSSAAAQKSKKLPN